MAGNSIGSAAIEIEADASEFASDAERAARTAGGRAGGEFSESFKKNAGASALGNFIGNALLSAAQSAVGAIKGLIGDAMSQSDAIDKFKATLNFAGLDTSTIERLTATTKAYADQTVYGLSFETGRYDIGMKQDYLRATVELAVEREDLGPEFRQFLADFVQRKKLI